jgi:hypothetical protein
MTELNWSSANHAGLLSLLTLLVTKIAWKKNPVVASAWENPISAMALKGRKESGSLPACPDAPNTPVLHWQNPSWNLSLEAG